MRSTSQWPGHFHAVHQGSQKLSQVSCCWAEWQPHLSQCYASSSRRALSCGSLSLRVTHWGTHCPQSHFPALPSPSLSRSSNPGLLCAGLGPSSVTETHDSFVLCVNQMASIHHGHFLSITSCFYLCSLFLSPDFIFFTSSTLCMSLDLEKVLQAPEDSWKSIQGLKPGSLQWNSKRGQLLGFPTCLAGRLLLELRENPPSQNFFFGAVLISSVCATTANILRKNIKTLFFSPLPPNA